MPTPHLPLFWSSGKVGHLTVLFALASLTRQPMSCAAVLLSSPEVGSSRRMTEGSVTNPMATLSRLRSPPLMPLIAWASSPTKVLAHFSSSCKGHHCRYCSFLLLKSICIYFQLVHCMINCSLNALHTNLLNSQLSQDMRHAVVGEGGDGMEWKGGQLPAVALQPRPSDFSQPSPYSVAAEVVHSWWLLPSPACSRCFTVCKVARHLHQNTEPFPHTNLCVSPPDLPITDIVRNYYGNSYMYDRLLKHTVAVAKSTSRCRT